MKAEDNLGRTGPPGNFQRPLPHDNFPARQLPRGGGDGTWALRGHSKEGVYRAAQIVNPKPSHKPTQSTHGDDNDKSPVQPFIGLRVVVHQEQAECDGGVPLLGCLWRVWVLVTQGTYASQSTIQSMRL